MIVTPILLIVILSKALITKCTCIVMQTHLVMLMITDVSKRVSHAAGRFQIASEIAAPLAQTKSVKMVSIGKGDVGASKLTGEVLDVMERLPKTVEGLTGVNITKVP